MQIIGGAELKPAHLISFDKLHVLDEFSLKIGAFSAVSDRAQHKAAVKAALDKIEAAGEVGRRLAIFALAAHELDVVCWPGVPGEFLCPEEASKAGRALARPTIMWDPYETFAYFGTRKATTSTRIQETMAAMEKTGGLVDSAPPKPKPAIYKATLMPAWVVLAHEIGHYFHYTRETAWFVECLNSGDIAGIERRNLADHETPILKHIDLPPRADYQDFRGGANDSADKHIQWGGLPHGDANLCAAVGQDLRRSKAVLDGLIRAAEVKKAEKDRKAKPVVPVSSGKTPCAKCGKPYSAMILPSHEQTCKGK